MTKPILVQLEQIVPGSYLAWPSAFSMQLVQGDSVLLKGRSGSGKSTIIQIIQGTRRAMAGELKCKSDCRIFSVPQNRALNEDSPAIEQIEIVKYLGAASDYRTRRDELAQKFGIADLTKKVSQYSGGEKERLALLRACLVPADVFLLDEPFSQLDSTMRDQCWSLFLQSIPKEAALVFISHDSWVPFGREDWREIWVPHERVDL